MMVLSKTDWLSYRAQHIGTMKVAEMSLETNKVILKMIDKELKRFPDGKRN